MILLKHVFWLWVLLKPIAAGYIEESVTSEATSSQENWTPEGVDTEVETSTLPSTMTARPKPRFSVRRSNNTTARLPILLKVDNADPAIHYYQSDPPNNNLDLVTIHPFSICHVFPITATLNTNCVPFEQPQPKKSLEQLTTPPTIKGDVETTARPRPRFSVRRLITKAIPNRQASKNRVGTEQVKYINEILTDENKTDGESEISINSIHPYTTKIAVSGEGQESTNQNFGPRQSGNQLQTSDYIGSDYPWRHVFLSIFMREVPEESNLAQQYSPISPFLMYNQFPGIQAKHFRPRERRNLANQLPLETLDSTPNVTKSLITNRQSNLLEDVKEEISSPTPEADQQYLNNTGFVTDLPHHLELSTEAPEYNTAVEGGPLSEVKDESTTLSTVTSSNHSTLEPTTSTVHPTESSKPLSQAKNTTTKSPQNKKADKGDALGTIVVGYLVVFEVGLILLIAVYLIKNKNKPVKPRYTPAPQCV